MEVRAYRERMAPREPARGLSPAQRALTRTPKGAAQALWDYLHAHPTVLGQSAP